MHTQKEAIIVRIFSVLLLIEEIFNQFDYYIKKSLFFSSQNYFKHQYFCDKLILMTIKVRLISKKKPSNSVNQFYKTSQIKSYSNIKTSYDLQKQNQASPNSLNQLSIKRKRNLSLKQLTSPRRTFKSERKIFKIQKTPWSQITKDQIKVLQQRLGDHPVDLYELVKKRKQFQVSKVTLHQNQSLSGVVEGVKFKKLDNKLSDYLKMGKQSKQKLNKVQSNFLLKKIQLKRKEYEQELKNIFKQKKLIIQTDLPKIGNIKQMNNSQLKMKTVDMLKPIKYPAFKFR